MSLTIERQLERVRGRVRGLALGMGVARVVAVLVGVVVGVVGVDYLLNLQAWPRVVLLVAGVVGVLVAVWRGVVVPMVGRLSLSDVAGRVEEAFPEFEDRLRSAVEFGKVGSGGGGGERGVESSGLREKVRAEAEAMAGGRDLRLAVPGGAAKAWMWRGLAAVVGLLVLGAVVPGEYRVASWERVVSPFGGKAWPKGTEIVVVGSLPERVAAGERIGVAVRLARGDKASARATVYYQYEGGPVRSEVMARGADGVYSASLDARASAGVSGGAGGEVGEGAAGLKVWVKAGDDEKKLSSVVVVPRLAVRKVVAEVVPPAYAAGTGGGTGGVFDLTQSPAVVVEGSAVRLKLEFNKALAGAPELVGVSGGASGVGGGVGGGEERRLKPPLQGQDQGWFGGAGVVVEKVEGSRAELLVSPEKTGRFVVAGVDRDGFKSLAVTEYEIVVRPDQAPAIQIELPRRSEERTATAAVPLEGMGEDDFALTTVGLNVKRLGDGKEWRIGLVEGGAAVSGVEWSAAASSPDRSRMRVRYLWELSSLAGAELKPGDVLEFFLSAKDNYRRERVGADGKTEVLEHAPATSSRMRITIVSQEDLAAKMADELRNAAGQIEQLRLSQRRTTDETKELASAVEKKPAMDEGEQRQARRLGEQQSVVASQSKQVAGKLEDLLRRMAENRLESKELATTARDVRDTLERASEGPMKDAAAAMNEARQAGEDAEKRNEKLGESEKQQEEADKLLGKALERLGSLGSLRQTIDNLRRMLAEQQEVSKQTRELAKENVGKRPEEMKPADRDKMKELSAKQKALGDRTEKMLGDMDKQSEQLQKSDPESAEALKKSSETGRQEGVPGAQSKASQSMEQNQQNQAQSEQRKAEIGLQVMLDQLKEAERRKLEALTKKLADLSEQLATLVRRQAGHNLDNLGLREGALKRVEAKELAGLLEKAERTAEKPAGADLGALSGGQEQTERNTRALSDSASQLQGAAEVATAISRAAGRMERAAVLLRKSDLAGAYEPPMVEALSALEEARKQVEEMKKKGEEELEQQQRESIKAQYVAIRGEQETLNRETTRLGALAGRGELPRAEAVRLGQLPGVQGALAERTAKIEEDLAALNSVVFIWANKDIVETMNDVKDALGQRKTDASVRIEQAKILEQLDAMIASLTIKPYEKEFEEKQGGGGGGGQGQGKPKLPGEAELRLLKGLQEAVNRATKAQAAIAPPGVAPADKAAVEGLARRQGELRRLLGEMVSKASQGKVRIPEEPKGPMAEESGGAEDENKELENDLLQGKPQDEKTDEGVTERVANRMGRARQRLAVDKDTGAVTQKVQERILGDLDRLIEEARKQDQQSSSSSSSKSKGGQPKPEPKPGNEQANNQGQQQGGQQQSGPSQNGAQSSNSAGGSAKDPGKQGGDLRERLAEWGAISPRQRQAIIEGAGDTPVEKYRGLIEDYYRSLAEKQSGGR